MRLLSIVALVSVCGLTHAHPYNSTYEGLQALASADSNEFSWINDLVGVAPAAMQALKNSTMNVTLFAPTNTGISNFLITPFGLSNQSRSDVVTILKNAPNSLLEKILLLHIASPALNRTQLMMNGTYESVWAPDIPDTPWHVYYNYSDSDNTTYLQPKNYLPQTIQVLNYNLENITDFERDSNYTDYIDSISGVLLPLQNLNYVNLSGFNSVSKGMPDTINANFSLSAVHLSKDLYTNTSKAQLKPLTNLFNGTVFASSNAAIEKLTLKILSYSPIPSYETLHYIYKTIARGQILDTAQISGQGNETKTYNTYLTLPNTMSPVQLMLTFNDSMLTSVSDGYSTAPVNGSYGPTLLKGSMLYYIDHVFTHNLSTADLVSDVRNTAFQLRAEYCNRNTSCTNANVFTSSDFKNIGFKDTENPYMDFKGCYFAPNADQMNAFATNITRGTFTNYSTLLKSDSASKYMSHFKQVLGAYLVPSGSLPTDDPECKYLDSTKSQLNGVKTLATNPAVYLSTHFDPGSIPPRTTYFTLHDNPGSSGRKLMSFTTKADLKGETAGPGSNTMFNQGGFDYTLSQGTENSFNPSAAHMTMPGMIALVIAVLSILA